MAGFLAPLKASQEGHGNARHKRSLLKGELEALALAADFRAQSIRRVDVHRKCSIQDNLKINLQYTIKKLFRTKQFSGWISMISNICPDRDMAFIALFPFGKFSNKANRRAS